MRIFTTNQEIYQIELCKLSAPIHLFNMGYTFLLSLQGLISIIHGKQHHLLHKQDIILIYPEESFSLHGAPDSYLLLITLDALHFNHCFKTQQRFVYFYSNDSDQTTNKNLRHYLINMATAHYTDTKNNDNYLMAQVYQLLHHLKTRPAVKAKAEAMNKTTLKQQAKIDKIRYFIDDNYSKQITLQELADHISLSPQYLAGFMKKHFQMTFYEYLNGIRLEATALLLKYSNESLNKIAIDGGFPNTSAFLKQFLNKHDMDPLDYRTTFLKMSEQAHIPPECQINNLPLIKGLLSDQAALSNTALTLIEAPVKEEICCNASKHKPFTPSFKKLINLGDASNFENPGFRKHLSLIQIEIGFEYGRIQNVFSLIDNCIVTGYIENDMTHIFRIIDYLSSLHLKPLFDIGSKHAHIYMNDLIENSQKYLSKTNYFEDILKPLLPIFLKSCINHYGFHTVSEWQFEFWQEYNNNMTIVESPLSYLNRFKYVYSTIKELVPKAYVGGPGFNTFMNTEHLSNTLDAMNKAFIKPDFVSIYVYPYNDEIAVDSLWSSDQVTLAPNQDIYKNRIEQCHRMIKQKWDEPPDLYVTEYGTHILNNNYMNDGLYPFSLIIRESLNNNSHAKAMSYWLLSDSSLDFKYSPYILFGGNGIISKDGIKKPGFFAYQFLNLLGNRIIAKGEHYIVTSSSKYNYQILAYYYGYFNEDYCIHQEDYESLKYPGSPFVILKPLSLSICLENLKEGTYHIKQWTLSETQGNLIHEWKKLGAKADLSNAEITYLKNKCTPSLSVEVRKVKQKLTFYTELKMHEAVLYQINLLQQMKEV